MGKITGRSLKISENHEISWFFEWKSSGNSSFNPYLVGLLYVIYGGMYFIYIYIYVYTHVFRYTMNIPRYITIYGSFHHLYHYKTYYVYMGLFPTAWFKFQWMESEEPWTCLVMTAFMFLFKISFHGPCCSTLWGYSWSFPTWLELVAGGGPQVSCKHPDSFEQTFVAIGVGRAPARAALVSVSVDIGRRIHTLAFVAWGNLGGTSYSGDSLLVAVFSGLQLGGIHSLLAAGSHISAWWKTATRALHCNRTGRRLYLAGDGSGGRGSSFATWHICVGE